MIKRSEKRGFRRFVLLVVKDFIQPFSFLKLIFISEKDYNENKEILIAHEYEHIRQKHFIDLLLLEVFTIVQWFNPFVWFLRRDLKLIHEYQADQAVLKKGIDAKKYQLLVIEKAVGERRFAMANHFIQKPILKRFKMMKKKKINRWNGLKLVLFVPLIIFLLQAFAKPGILPGNAAGFIPVIQHDETAKWLEKWNKENIGEGFFQPEAKLAESNLKENNVLVILLNAKNEYLIENRFAKKEDVKEIVKEFLNGRDQEGKTVTDYEEKNIPLAGKMKISKGLVSFRHDLVSSDGAINFTLRCVGEAYLEARNNKAEILFGEDYFSLDVTKRDAVDLAVPIRVSVLPPKVTTSNSPPPPPPPTVNLSVSKEGDILLGEYTKTENGERKLVRNKKITLEELQDYLDKLKTFVEEVNKEYGTKHKIPVKVDVEAGVSDQQISSLKEVVKKNGNEVEFYKGSNIKIVHVFSIIIDEDGNQLDLDKTKKSAEEAVLNSNGNCSAIIRAKEGVSSEYVNAVKEVLKKAGIRKITENPS
jgi:hypothetical protein